MCTLTPLLDFEMGNIGGFQNRIHSVEFAIADQEANFYHGYLVFEYFLICFGDLAYGEK